MKKLIMAAIIVLMAMFSVASADGTSGLKLTTYHNGNPEDYAYVKCYTYTGTWDYVMTGQNNLSPWFHTARFAAEGQSPPRHIIPAGCYYKFYAYKNIGGTIYYSSYSKTMYYQYDYTGDSDDLDMDNLNPPPDDMK